MAGRCRQRDLRFLLAGRSGGCAGAILMGWGVQLVVASVGGRATLGAWTPVLHARTEDHFRRGPARDLNIVLRVGYATVSAATGTVRGSRLIGRRPSRTASIYSKARDIYPLFSIPLISHVLFRAQEARVPLVRYGYLCAKHHGGIAFVAHKLHRHKCTRLRPHAANTMTLSFVPRRCNPIRPELVAASERAAPSDVNMPLQDDRRFAHLPDAAF